jgi:hypothetical protein
MKKKKTKTVIFPRSMRPPACVRSLLPCLVVLLIIPAVARARQRPAPKNSAVIFGTVWGPDDRPVYGVTVKIRRGGDKRARWEVHSNHLGEFEQLVPAGKETYVIWADTKGFKTPQGKYLQPGAAVTVQIEDKERVNTGVHLK